MVWGFRPSSELALISNMMYLPRVQANTQIKSESLQTKEDTIKRKLRQLVCNELVVRQQTHEMGRMP